MPYDSQYFSIKCLNSTLSNEFNLTYDSTFPEGTSPVGSTGIITRRDTGEQVSVIWIDDNALEHLAIKVRNDTIKRSLIAGIMAITAIAIIILTIVGVTTTIAFCLPAAAILTSAASLFFIFSKFVDDKQSGIDRDNLLKQVALRMQYNDRSNKFFTLKSPKT